MLTLIDSGALAPLTSTAFSLTPPAPSPGADPNRVRHLLFGTLATVQATIRHLHQLGYAEVNDWSEPIATGRPNEVMAILTKRVRIEP
ncbi:MAG: hypothetical protein WBB01_09920 [Phormidesmis sp.]